MVLVAGHPVSHRHIRRIIEIFGKRIAIRSVAANQLMKGKPSNLSMASLA